MTLGSLLIVEDESIVALDLRHNLENLGYRVVGLCATGEDAIRQAACHRPDLVLMDIHLAGQLSGTEAARQIREQQQIPSIFLTAYAEEDILRQAENSAPYGYLLKPYQLRELNATVRMALACCQATQEGERQQRRLQLAVEAAALGVWEWDGEQQAFHVGGEFDRIFDQQAPLPDGSKDAFLNSLHSDDRQRLQPLLEQGRPLNTVVQLATPATGKPQWVELHARSFSTPGSRHQRVVGVARDVTRQRQMEQQLRQASIVFQTSAEGILILDAQRRIVSANAAFTQLTGYPSEAALQRNPDDFLHVQPHAEPFYQQLADNTPDHWHGDMLCQRRDGSQFPCRQHICAVNDEQGQLSHYVLAFSDLSAIRAAEEHIHHLAYHDELTGLGNRHHLQRELEKEIRRAERNGHSVGILFVDLDGFKQVNDTLGHGAGDQLLASIAKRLQRQLRSSDIATRQGGDEFLLAIPDVQQPEDCAWLAENLLAIVRDPIMIQGETIRVSGSIGIALYPADGADIPSLLKAADSAMYAAKKSGKNRYRFFSSEMTSQAKERLQVEQGLQQALAQQQLRVFYQPTFSLRDGTIHGFEALLRWQHPQLGLLPSARFISVAEEAGLLTAMELWLLKTVCQQGRQWQQQAGRPLNMAVNLSATTLASATFCQQLAEILQQSQLPAACLALEINETTLQALDQREARLSALQHLGVSLTVDDFGSGASSLLLLQQPHFSRLKISQTFIDGGAQHPSQQAILHTLGQLARQLNVQLSAKNIETLSQWQLLQGSGCDSGQGYLLCPPLPAEAIAHMFGQALHNPVGELACAS
ncbi:MAG TPA: EAL domain-containing protein [Chromobacteriaceae bacterium]|nr:EAL domain-containing protein [Chromobacteriaceae bacterium]